MTEIQKNLGRPKCSVSHLAFPPLGIMESVDASQRIATLEGSLQMEQMVLGEGWGKGRERHLTPPPQDLEQPGTQPPSYRGHTGFQKWPWLYKVIPRFTAGTAFTGSHGSSEGLGCFLSRLVHRCPARF